MLAILGVWIYSMEKEKEEEGLILDEKNVEVVLKGM